MSFEVKVYGVERLITELQKLQKKYPKALAGALYQEGFDIWRESVKRTPVEFGILRGSAYVAPPTQGKGDALPRVEIGFGTQYAIPQHERLDYKHPRGGRAKYLESTVNEAMATMLARVTRRTKLLAASGQGVMPLPAPKRPKVGSRKKHLARRKRDKAKEKRRLKKEGKPEDAAGAQERATKAVAAAQRKRRGAARRRKREARRRARERKLAGKAPEVSVRQYEKRIKAEEDNE